MPAKRVPPQNDGIIQAFCCESASPRLFPSAVPHWRLRLCLVLTCVKRASRTSQFSKSRGERATQIARVPRPVSHCLNGVCIQVCSIVFRPPSLVCRFSLPYPRAALFDQSVSARWFIARCVITFAFTGRHSHRSILSQTTFLTVSRFHDLKRLAESANH